MKRQADDPDAAERRTRQRRERAQFLDRLVDDIDWIEQDMRPTNDVVRSTIFHMLVPYQAQQLSITCRMLRRVWYATIHEIPKSAFQKITDCYEATPFYALRTLDLSRSPAALLFSDDCLTRFTQLRDLDISESGVHGDQRPRITDGGLSSMTRLERLNISRNGAITAASLRRLPKLKWLSLDQNQVIHSSDLASLSAVETLALGSNQYITDDAFTAPSSRLPATLTTLNVARDTDITDFGLTRLTSLTSLRLVSSTGITIDGLVVVTSLRALEIVNSDRFTDRDLSQLPWLTRLVVHNTPEITGWSFMHMTALSSLGLHTAIDRDALRNSAFVSTLRDLHVVDQWIAPDDLAMFTALHTLKIEYDSHTHIGGIRELTGLTSLRMKNLHVNVNEFGKLEGLEDISLHSCSLGMIPGDIYYLTGLPNIRVLDARGCSQITDHVLSLLKSLRRLVLDEGTGTRGDTGWTNPDNAIRDGIKVETLLYMPSLVEVACSRKYFERIRTYVHTLRSLGIRVRIVEAD